MLCSSKLVGYMALKFFSGHFGGFQNTRLGISHNAGEL